MTKEIAYYTSNDLTKAETVTNSLIIAEVFGRRHNNVMTNIRKIIKRGNFNLLHLKQIDYVDDKGRTYPMFEMGEREFLKIAPFIGGSKAEAGQDCVIDALYDLREELGHRTSARLEGKVQRRALIDAIDECIPDDDHFKRLAYPNYTNMVYRVCFGQTTKERKKSKGLRGSDSLRDNESQYDLERITTTEVKTAGLIHAFKSLDYSTIKAYQQIRGVLLP